MRRRYVSERERRHYAAFFFNLSENAGDDRILLRFLEYSIFIKILFSETSRSGTEKIVSYKTAPVA